MRVNLLFFAAIEELVGRREASLDLPDGDIDAARLPAILEREFPELQGRLGAVRLAVNESFVDPQDPIADGDTVALIPPVSGG